MAPRSTACSPGTRSRVRTAAALPSAVPVIDAGRHRLDDTECKLDELVLVCLVTNEALHLKRRLRRLGRDDDLDVRLAVTERTGRHAVRCPLQVLLELIGAPSPFRRFHLEDDDLAITLDQG